MATLPLELWERIAFFRLLSGGVMSVLPLRGVSRWLRLAVDGLLQRLVKTLLPVRVSSLWSASRPTAGKYFESLPVQLQINASLELDWTFLVRFCSPRALLVKQLYDNSLTFDKVHESVQRLVHGFQPPLQELSLQSLGTINMNLLNGLPPLQQLAILHGPVDFSQSSWGPDLHRLVLQNVMINLRGSLMHWKNMRSIVLRSVNVACADDAEHARDVLLHAPHAVDFRWTGRRLRRTRFDVFAVVELFAPALESLQLSFMDPNDNEFELAESPCNLHRLAIGCCNGVRQPWKMIMEAGARDVYALQRMTVREAKMRIPLHTDLSGCSNTAPQRLYLGMHTPMPIALVPWELLLCMPSLRVLHLYGYIWETPPPGLQMPQLAQVWFHLSSQPWLADAVGYDVAAILPGARPAGPTAFPVHSENLLLAMLMSAVASLATLPSRPAVFVLCTAAMAAILPTDVASLVTIVTWDRLRHFDHADFVEYLPGAVEQILVDLNTPLPGVSAEDE